MSMDSGVDLSPRVVVTYHPATALYPGGEVYFQYLLDDLKRLWHSDISPPRIGVPKPSRVLGVDTEYCGDTLLTVGVSDGASMYAWEPFEEHRETIRELLSAADVLVVHSMPEDVYRLIEAGLAPPKPDWLSGSRVIDSLLLAKLEDENRPSFRLEDLLAGIIPGRLFGWKHETSHKSPETWTREERINRCQLDAWATLEIARRLIQAVPETLLEFTARTAAVLFRLHLAGAVVDLDRFDRISERIEAKTLEAADYLTKLAIRSGMTEFSATNDNKLRELVYDRLGLPKISVTDKTGVPAVSRPVLEALRENTADGSPAAEILDALIEFSILEKFESTYSKGLKKLVTVSGRLSDGSRVGYLPFHFNPLVRTGRRSSHTPNSQNWPKEARRIVRSRWAEGKIGAFDFQRLEPCVIAWLAGDEELLGLFQSSNGYLKIASELIKQPVEEGTPMYRAIKSIVLGVHYDMRSPEMARQLWNKGIRFGSPEEHLRVTDEIRTAYLRRFPRLEMYMRRQREERLRTGEVVMPSGRVRHLPGYGKRLDNQAINAPVQGTASDITASALLDVERELLSRAGVSLQGWVSMLYQQRRMFLDPSRNLGTVEMPWEIPVLFNEVHDELTLDIPPGWPVNELVELVVETMRAVPTFRRLVRGFDITLNVTPVIASHWHGEDQQ